ncbi:MAG TPA: hypothetical protein DD613_01615 [Firmicutes bacterium]|jgi:DNA replication protein|nr:hypothetical protein [Bacillota bacterium]
MNNVRASFKTKNFIINENVVKTIKNLDITLKEFLLLLYFINIKALLDLNDIKKVLGFNEEEILNTYTSLITKGLIEVKVFKDSGVVSEVISLDMFYDKLVMNTKNEENNTDIYSKFESEFGRSLSPIEYETINRWLENGVSEEIITSALKEAVINGASNLRYIDKIIYEWTKKGVKPKEEDYTFIDDFDWLNDGDEED